MLIAILAGVIGIAILIVVLGKKAKSKRLKDKYYDALCSKYEFKKFVGATSAFSGKLFTAEGEHKGLDFKITEVIRKSGSSKKVFTNVEVIHHSGFDFRIAKETFFTHLIKYVGVTDIEFEDVELDKTYLFKSSDESSFREFMKPDILALLLSSAKNFNGLLEAKDNKLTYTVQSTLSDESMLEEIEAMMFLILTMKRS